MKQKKEVIKEIKLVGISTTTKNEFEMSAQTSNIGVLVNRYHLDGIAGMIPHRKNPGVTFSAYTDYESDHHGQYTYFIGEEVTKFDQLPKGLTPVIIPEGVYMKFTTDEGPMPRVIIDAWQEIWHMSEKQLGGKRTYHTDFQIHDKRAEDPQRTIIDIYVGIIPTL